MLQELIRSFKLTFILSLILCGGYPLVVWGLGNLFFGEAATGGIVYRDGKPIGAKFIGQSFTKPEYLQGRPSAAGQNGYDAAGSSGSNLGPTSKKLSDRVQANVARILKENPTASKGRIPVELVTASGSGLDPQLSPEGAAFQVDRIAKARGISQSQVNDLLKKHTHGPQWGLLGETTVDVLAVNLELDEMTHHKN